LKAHNFLNNLKLSISKKIFLGFGLPVLLMLLVLVLLFTSSEQQLTTAKWVEHTHEVISKGHELTKLLVDMETGERGFLITGNPIFLAPFDDALKVWPAKLTAIKLLVSDNIAQVERISEISKLQQLWLVQAAQKEITARKKVKADNLVSMAEVIQLIEAQTGKDIIDRIRAIKTQFIMVEENLMTKRKLIASNAVKQTKLVVLVGGISSVLLALFISFYISSNIVRNLGKLVTTTEKVSSGEFEHVIEIESHDEFSVLAKSFNSMTLSLKESTEKMESAVKVKTDFLANMSHEIRTPMNGILGMLTLLEDTNLSKQQLEYIESIRSCGDGLLVVINDILDISKLESGKLLLEKQTFDLNKLINESCFLLDNMASQKGLTLSISTDKQLPSYLVGDRLRIRQILLNLLSNAIKFTDKGVVEIILNIDSIKEDECSINIDIIDQGIGISTQDIDKLFKPFSQVDSSTTRIYGGTGLGLIICAQLIRQMAGTITVQSKEGQGSTFSLKLALPIDKAGRAVELNHGAVETPSTTVLASEIPLTILIAEDNNINQIIARKLFSKLGYEVDIAVNGIKAVEAVKNKHFDMIFMDMQMPEMDGVTATKEILLEPMNEHLIIVAMTANVLDQDRNKCFEAGMVGFVGKPINLGDIAKEIKRLKG